MRSWNENRLLYNRGIPLLWFKMGSVRGNTIMEKLNFKPHWLPHSKCSRRGLLTWKKAIYLVMVLLVAHVKANKNTNWSFLYTSVLVLTLVNQVKQQDSDYLDASLLCCGDKIWLDSLCLEGLLGEQLSKRYFLGCKCYAGSLVWLSFVSLPGNITLQMSWFGRWADNLIERCSSVVMASKKVFKDCGNS